MNYFSALTLLAGDRKGIWIWSVKISKSSTSSTPKVLWKTYRAQPNGVLSGKRRRLNKAGSKNTQE